MPRIRSASTRAHKREAPRAVSSAVLTVSTRGAAAAEGAFDDRSGDLLADRLGRAGRRLVGRALVRDGVAPVRKGVRTLLRARPDLLVVTGGTGLAPKDLTIEAVRPLFEREVAGFGPLFLHYSIAEIGAAAILSRATAGVIRRPGAATWVVLLPGSPNAVRLALEKILIPEAAHIVKHLRE